MRNAPTFLLVCLGLFATMGCGDSTTTPPADAAVDVTPDVTPDVTADVTVDAPADVTVDVTADVARDVTSDASTDTAGDAPADVTADASNDASGDAGFCGGSTCAVAEVCLRQRTLGGAFLPPDDAGTCPAGRHVEGASCVADFTYRCAARPVCAANDCTCLGALCPSSFMCRGVEASVLTCEQLAP